MSAPKHEVDNTIQFLLTAGECKATLRQGWVQNNIRSPESVAAHMHRMALLCMMCPDATLDKERMIKMALCHDVPEAVAGDVTPLMKVAKEVKVEKERAGMTAMAALIPGCSGDLMHALWEEYEAQETREAHFVRDMDLLEMIVQGYRYEVTDSKDLSSFFGCVPRLVHPWARSIGERLVELREMRRQGDAAGTIHPLPKDLATRDIPTDA
jgi:putative hydrolase of HD superfamily